MRTRTLILFFLTAVLTGGWSAYLLFSMFPARGIGLAALLPIVGSGISLYFAAAFVRHWKDPKLVPKVGVEVIALMVVAVIVILALLFYALANV